MPGSVLIIHNLPDATNERDFDMGTKNNPGKYDCYHNLKGNEPYFVLMGRDPAACAIVHEWANSRERTLNAHLAREGANRVPADYVTDERAKIAEARACADAMRDYCVALGKTPVELAP